MNNQQLTKKPDSPAKLSQRGASLRERLTKKVKALFESDENYYNKKEFRKIYSGKVNKTINKVVTKVEGITTSSVTVSTLLKTLFSHNGYYYNTLLQSSGEEENILPYFLTKFASPVTTSVESNALAIFICLCLQFSSFTKADVSSDGLSLSHSQQRVHRFKSFNDMLFAMMEFIDKVKGEIVSESGLRSVNSNFTDEQVYNSEYLVSNSGLPQKFFSAIYPKLNNSELIQNMFLTSLQNRTHWSSKEEYLETLINAESRGTTQKVIRLDNIYSFAEDLGIITLDDTPYDIVYGAGTTTEAVNAYPRSYSLIKVNRSEQEKNLNDSSSLVSKINNAIKFYLSDNEKFNNLMQGKSFISFKEFPSNKPRSRFGGLGLETTNISKTKFIATSRLSNFDASSPEGRGTFLFQCLGYTGEENKAGLSQLLMILKEDFGVDSINLNVVSNKAVTTTTAAADYTKYAAAATLSSPQNSPAQYVHREQRQDEKTGMAYHSGPSPPKVNNVTEDFE